LTIFIFNSLLGDRLRFRKKKNNPISQHQLIFHQDLILTVNQIP